jgi:hypothetical protein
MFLLGTSSAAVAAAATARPLHRLSGAARFRTSSMS